MFSPRTRSLNFVSRSRTSTLRPARASCSANAAPPSPPPTMIASRAIPDPHGYGLRHQNGVRGTKVPESACVTLAREHWRALSGFHVPVKLGLGPEVQE